MTGSTIALLIIALIVIVIIIDRIKYKIDHKDYDEYRKRREIEYIKKLGRLM